MTMPSRPRHSLRGFLEGRRRNPTAGRVKAVIKRTAVAKRRESIFFWGGGGRVPADRGLLKVRIGKPWVRQPPSPTFVRLTLLRLRGVYSPQQAPGPPTPEEDALPSIGHGSSLDHCLYPTGGAHAKLEPFVWGWVEDTMSGARQEGRGFGEFSD